MLTATSIDALLEPIAPRPHGRAVIFTGPSLSRSEAERRIPGADIRPPIRRGDLPRVIAEGYDLVGIIDGTYVHERTVSAVEILAALAQGVRIYGASSLGALRAVEFGGQGLMGVGIIYDWYRQGVTIRDDEVVVAMNPETFASLNDPLINLRYACLQARRRGLIDHAEAAMLLTRYASYHFSERTYGRLFRELRSGPGLSSGVLRFETFVREERDAVDLKRRDACALLDHITEAHLLAA